MDAVNDCMAIAMATDARVLSPLGDVIVIAGSEGDL